MSTRLLSAALAATGLVTTLVVSAPSASATCTITDYSPHSVVVGLVPVEKTFGVPTTGCTPLVWDVTVNINGLVVLADNTDPGVTFDPNDLFNSDAGVKSDAYVRAYDEAAVKSQLFLPESFVVKRATKWTAFNASPEPVTKGQPIKITGSLKSANWDALAWSAQKGSTVRVQFMPAGGTTFTTVKTVYTSSTYGTVSTTVTATVDGTWRLYYGGSGSRGSATSATDYVDVR